jgi:hypothetical protein
VLLPEPLSHFADEIERSRSMLELPDDWDEQGSPGYTEATWRRAVGFLVESASRFWSESGRAVSAPRIRKGPDGSIDLDWRSPGRELLVNIPAAPTEPATYYGDDGAGGNPIKGTLDPSLQAGWLLRWFAA